MSLIEVFVLVPTFVAFLTEIESPYEVSDFCSLFYPHQLSASIESAKTATCSYKYT